MSETYKCFAIVAPGKFELQERQLPMPAVGEVRLRVEACGVCHSDSATVNAEFPGLALPRVPGHEVVGRIDALGEGVTEWSIGDRVGIGFLGGQDNTCRHCRRGDYVNCLSPHVTGITRDGGYAEVMLAHAHGVVAIPESLESVAAAPMLCAGLTTFNALRTADLRAGDLVAVHGLGGLGHLGVQYARKMGFRTVAVAGGVTRQSLPCNSERTNTSMRV